MLKRKIDNYLQDYYKTSRNALLITGARQTGKRILYASTENATKASLKLILLRCLRPLLPSGELVTAKIFY